MSEKLSDVVDPRVKYGGGSEMLKEALMLASETFARIERLEREAPSVEADALATRNPAFLLEMKRLRSELSELSDEALRAVDVALAELDAL